MISPRKIPGATAVVLALAVGGVASSPASAEKYDLRSCVVLALKNTLQTEQARSNLKSAEADVTGARSGFLPNLSLGGSWRKPEETIEFQGGQPVVFDAAFWSANGSVQLNVFDGFGTWNEWKAARHGRDSAEDNYLAARQSVVFETEVRYVEVLKQQALLEVSNQSLEVSSEQLKKTEAMRELGAATLADVYKSQVDHQNNILTQLGVERDLRVAKAALATWIGLDPRLEMELEEQDPWEDVPYTLDEAIAQAQQNNPEISAVASRVDSGKHAVRSARSTYWPALDLFASAGQTESEINALSWDGAFWEYGVQLRWTVFDGLLTKSRVNRAQSGLNLNRRQQETTERDVLFRVSQAWYDLEVARRAIEVGGVAEQSSEEDLRLAQERFRIGEGTILDVIDAQVNLTRAKTDLVDYRAAARLVAARLRNAIGELPVPEPEDIEG